MDRMIFSTMQRLGWVVVVAGLCVGCETMQPKVDFAEPKPAPIPSPAARPVTGSLFQPVGYRPAFEDRRARVVATP